MNSQQIFTRPRNVFLLAVLCCLLWGSAFPAVKIGYSLFAIDKNDPMTMLLFAGCRFVGAGLLLLLVARRLGLAVLSPGWRNAGELALMGLLQTAVQYIFFYIGIAHTTGVKASILNAVSVFFSIGLAHMLYADDRLTLRKALGCLLGFSGVVIVNVVLPFGGHVADQSPDLDFSLMGEGFIVLGSLAFSVASVYGKRLSRKMPSIVMTGYQLAIGGAVLMAAGGLGGGALNHWSVPAGALLAYQILLSAIAFALWATLLLHNRVSTVTVYFFLVPVFGVGLSALLLNDRAWTPTHLVALVLVSLGILIVTTARSRPRL